MLTLILTKNLILNLTRLKYNCIRRPYWLLIEDFPSRFMGALQKSKQQKRGLVTFSTSRENEFKYYLLNEQE